MKDLKLLEEIGPAERTPLVEWLLSVIAHQQAIIAQQSSQIEQLKGQVEQLEDLEKLSFSEQVICQGESAWAACLESLDIVTPLAVRLVTEAALLGSVISHGVSSELIILSDGAPQFVLFVHALCWIHMERALRKLSDHTPEQLKEIESLRYQLWAYY